MVTVRWSACARPLSHRSAPRASWQAFEAVGPHNIYFIYDTCPLRSLEAWLQESGKSMRWLTKALRTELSTNGQVSTCMACIHALSTNG